MGALASSTKWNPEDDLLLKNAVEAGASLESLAKGAVHFSRRFTIQELEERWSSLLYDLNTSTEASARIVEIEIGVSVFNPSKHGRACKVKEILSGRRKGESLLCHYSASRKKARNEPHKSSNLGFLVPPSSDAVLGHESGSHDQFKLQNEFAIDKFPGGMPFSNDYGHPETIYGGSQHAYSKMGEIESTAVTSSHVFHGGMVGSIESGVPDGISSRDVLYGHPENISTFTIDEAGYKGVGENFESNLTQKNFPHSLDRNHCSSQTSGVPESRPLQSLALNDPNVNGDIEAKPSADFALTNNEQENIYSDFGGNHNPVSKFAGSSPSFHQLGYSTLPPDLPIWKTIEDVSTPTLQMDGQFEEKGQVVLTMEGIKKIDDQACDDATPKSKLNDGTSCAALNNSTILSEDNFIDFSSSCMSFTEDEELLFIDVDDDDIGDRSCLNGLSSIFLSSPSDTHMDNLPNPSESKPSEAFNTSIPACNIESSMEHETMHDEINTGSSNIDTTVVPGVGIISASSVASPTAAPVETSMICVLNTEDLEVPCNDDVSFSAKLCQTFATCLRNDAANTLANDGKATSGGLALVIGGKVASLQLNASNFKAGQQLPKVGLLHSTADYVQDDESSDRDVASGASRIFNKDMDDPDKIPPTVTSYSASDIALKHEASTELNMQAPLPKCMPSHLEIVSTELGCIDLLPSVSISDQEEQFVEDDEYDVPNFSDVEAMILDMDLGPYDQESCLFSKEVSRYQCLDTKKTIIRLEQGTRSYMNRAISSHGAFAVFYGRHLKYFIRTPEVLLGRETEDIKVDIDLGKEGRANKISRRQAIIKMDGDGTFHLKNIGKSSIFVNSKEVPVKKRINLCSRALIEIKDMRFIFEVNDLAVRRHITSLQQISQGPKSEYDFVCTSELHG